MSTFDKEAIVKAFGYGYYTAAYQLPSKNSSAYDSTIPGRKYDVAKAKQLMTDAGYPNGFKSSLIAPSSTKPGPDGHSAVLSEQNRHHRGYTAAGSRQIQFLYGGHLG